MDVDEDEEDGDQQGHPPGDDLGVHKEAETIATMMITMISVALMILLMRKKGVVKDRFNPLEGI